MTQKSSNKASKFEEALDTLSLATWNRTRSTTELLAFLDRREAAVQTADIDA